MPIKENGTDCAVENEGSHVIGEFVDGRVVQFWSCRRESNCHMAKRWGCCEVEPPSKLLFYVPERRLANLRPGWLLHGTEFSRLSDPECRHPGPTGRCHTASDWPSERLCTDQTGRPIDKQSELDKKQPAGGTPLSTLLEWT